jgi:AcrR family transcriptional regulator
MENVGLRERKKARMRRHIAAAAARLFAEHGYERVSVSDVARAAEVAEQTVYNHFGSKEQLVTDRDEEVQDRLCSLIRARPPGTTPAAAVREYAFEFISDMQAIDANSWHGEFGYLAAISPTVQRLALELAERQATALGQAISESSPVAPEVARLQGIALSSVFRIIVSESGRLAVEGQSQAEIADTLHAVVSRVLDELDRWFSPPGGPAADA